MFNVIFLKTKNKNQIKLKYFQEYEKFNNWLAGYNSQCSSLNTLSKTNEVLYVG